MKKKGVRKKKVIKWANILLVIGIFVLIATMGYTAFKQTEPAKSDMSYVEFMSLVDNNQIDRVDMVKNEDTFNAYTLDGTEYAVINPDNEDFRKELLEKGINLEVRKSTFNDALASLILSIPTIAMVFILCIFVMKYMGGTATTMFKLIKNEECTTFEDVAGMDETKTEVQFAIDTLKHYKELYRAGARPTKGIILEGPPGTGKTLIAKAIAGEAKVPFISTSGSDFVEMFAGLGASRVRALWELAITNAPCVIFIDEIDAVGRRRQSANSGAQMESNQTLNALLQKMDGLGGDSGILVVAATNMIHDLDPALLRPGRFDKKIYVGAPNNKKDRDAIIKVHLRHKKLEESLDFDRISKHMFGMTGAEIESVLNEAVILSIRQGRKGIISEEDIDISAMKLRVSGTVVNNYTNRDKFTASVHEAGHAIMNCLVGREVTKVSIVAYSSGVGGVTVTDSDQELNQFRTVTDFKNDLKVLFAGQIAEKIVTGTTSTGCSNDFQRATEIAKNMVGTWAMVDNYIANINVMRTEDKGQFLEEVHKLLNKTYNEAREILMHKENEITTLAKMLMESEVIIDFKLDSIIGIK